jgi:hypothetical protein
MAKCGGPHHTAFSDRKITEKGLAVGPLSQVRVSEAVTHAARDCSWSLRHRLRRGD